LSDTHPRLHSLIFETTQQCNHACLYCYNIWNPDSRGRVSDYPQGQLNTSDTIRMLTKALDETRCQHVTLTGGEPLLRKDLPQIVEFLHNRDIATTIISNGHLLSEPVVVDYLERGVGLFELPLLSHRRKIHDQLSGCPGAFDAVLAAMAHIRYQRGQFVSVFVATKINLPDLYETIKMAYAFGARGMMFNRVNIGGRARDHLDALMPSVDQIRNALTVADRAADEFSFPISCSIPIQPCLVDTSIFNHLDFGYCAAGTERAYYTIDPLGNLRPCNHTTTILGNLMEEPFVELISPERMSPFMEAVPSFCDPCSLRDICKGGCKAAAQVCYGSLSAEEPFLHINLERARPLVREIVKV
jgi:radical SAM protein with 4Fe4S-binding SPASM domain